MKQIVKNSYIKTTKFMSSQEASTYVGKQGIRKHLFIDEIVGDNYYCCVCCHSLTNEKQFILTFNSDKNEDSLGFLFWDSLFVLDTGTNIYLIDESLSIRKSLEITTPLMGLYLISNEKLLVLEEAYMRIINYNGDIVQTELFDLIKDFSIKDNLLSVQTDRGDKVIKLT